MIPIKTGKIQELIESKGGSSPAATKKGGGGDMAALASAAQGASPWAAVADAAIGGIVSVITGGQKSKLEKFKTQKGSNLQLTGMASAQHDRRVAMQHQLRMGRQQKTDNSNLMILGGLGFFVVILVVLIIAFRN